MARTLVVGDVHGCLDELEALLREVALDNSDTLVFVGDLVAKGPDTQGVLKLARERGALCVRGNHEQRLLNYRRGKLNAPKPALEAVADSLSAEDWRFVGSMPLWRRLDDRHLVVHAGFVPGVRLGAQRPVFMMNLRSLLPDGSPSTKVTGVPWASRWKGPETVFFGHDAVRGLQRYPHAIGLDTGCVYGGALSGWIVEEQRLVQVPASRAWCEPGKAAR